MDAVHQCPVDLCQFIVDEVAYVRFASVYRQFKDINVFIDELKDLLNKNPDDKISE